MNTSPLDLGLGLGGCQAGCIFGALNLQYIPTTDIVGTA